MNRNCCRLLIALLSMLFVCVFCLSAAYGETEIEINSQNFPDDIFREYVKKFDSSKDGKLSQKETEKVTEISLIDKKVTTLKGVELFPNLVKLTCTKGNLKAIDVSKNTKLAELTCSNNQITSIDLRDNTLLTKLYCNGNKLTTLDVSANTELTALYCYMNELTSINFGNIAKITELWCFDNELTTLNISNFSELNKLFCDNNKLSELKVDRNTKLTGLDCASNELTKLELANNTALKELDCADNKLTQLDLKNNGLLQQLSCFDNSIKTLDFRSCPELTIIIDENDKRSIRGHYTWGEGTNTIAADTFVWVITETIQKLDESGTLINEQNFPDPVFREYLKSFDKSGNGRLGDTEKRDITSLDLKKRNITTLKGIEFLTYLERLDCSSNKLSSLDISKNAMLHTLNCEENEIQSLDISNNTKLWSLRCKENKLMTLATGSNTALSELNCSDNQIKKLDISKNTNLNDINCSYNELTVLDISKNLNLRYINCSSNQLKELTVSHLVDLYTLQCSNNELTILDIKANTQLNYLVCGGNKLKELDASNNHYIDQIFAQNNELKKLNIGDNSKLWLLECEYNELTELDVSKATALKWFHCDCNQLKKLDISCNTKLTSLTCRFNLLTELDIRNCPALIELTRTGMYDEEFGWSGNQEWLFIDKTIRLIPVSVISVALDYNSFDLLPGESQYLTASIYPACSANQDISWTSNHPEIAKVDADGKVTAVAPGNAIITVKTADGGKTATCTVMVSSVTPDSVSVTGVTLNKTDMSLTEGDFETLVATITPSNATNGNVVWSSSNDSVAIVNSNGIVSAMAFGKATITVTTEDGKKTASCNVTVEPKDKVTGYVVRCYNIILGREPDAGGMKTWYNELVSGRKAASEIIDNFVRSQEFIGKHYSNADAVEILYKAMLGRGSDPAGKADWVGKLDAGYPFAVVINGFCGSKEFKEICDSYGIAPGSVSMEQGSASDQQIRAFVTRCYKIILGRDADEVGMSTWFNELKSRRRTAAEIIEQFVYSQEFQNKKYSNPDAVEILYKAMLGRGSDPAGKADWVGRLNNGQPLTAIINGFCGSMEFTSICEAYGITPGSVKVENLSRAAEEPAENAVPKTEKKANLVEITNASDTVNEQLGTAVQAIYINEEKAKEFIGRCYQAILGREAGAEELNGWIGQMMNGSKTADQIARGFLFSGEFKGRNIGNEELVKILYRVYMNREADPEGLATWTQKLDEGTSLNDLLNVFAKTGEFKGVVAEMGK